MARKKRIWYPGATYHVMSRGNRRGTLFREHTDYLLFLEYLKILKEKFPFRIHALCLMTNHFHIAIETQETSLSKLMQKLLHLYASEFNNRYQCTGHLFESRFTSCLIEDERYFLEVSRYIHLNPVKAMMVRKPEEYEYASYSMFLSDTSDKEKSRAYSVISGLVDTSRTLGSFRKNIRDEYRMFVEGKISHAEQELLIQKDMKEDDMWLVWLVIQLRYLETVRIYAILKNTKDYMRKSQSMVSMQQLLSFDEFLTNVGLFIIL